MADVNEFFIDPKKRRSAAQAALYQTELGRQGVVELSQDKATGKISYIFSATGEIFDSADDAFIRASKALATNFSSVLSSSAEIGSEAYNTRFAQAGNVVLDMVQGLKNAKEDKKILLEKIGLGSIDADTLSLGIITTKAEGKGAVLGTAQALDKLGMGYIPIVEADGGTFLTMKAIIGGKETHLTTTQMHMMTTILGGGILNNEKLLSNFLDRTGKASQLIDKLPKRLKAFFSERDMVIDEKDILRSIGNDKVGAKLEDSVLRTDTGVDYLKKYFGFDARSTPGLTVEVKGKTYNLINELFDKKIVDKTISNIATDAEKIILSTFEVKELIKNATSSEDILKKLDLGVESGIYSKETQAAVERVIGGIKKEVDGITLVNKRIISYKLGQLDERLTELRDALPSAVGADAERIRISISEIGAQYDLIENSDNWYQATFRGGLGSEQIKTAGRFQDFEDMGPRGLGLFSGFSTIIDKEATKGELGLNTGQFIISGLGQNSKRVYADPVSLAFSGHLFASEYDIDNAKKYSAEIIQDFYSDIQQSILPPRIKEMLNRTIYDKDLDEIPEFMMDSRSRNKQYAREILEMHQSGISPQDSPRMLNMLASLHAAEMYRTKTKGDARTYLPALHDVRRYAVSTEGSDSIGKKWRWRSCRNYDRFYRRRRSYI